MVISDPDKLISQPQHRDFLKELRILAVVTAISISQGFITGCDTVWSYFYKDNYSLSIVQSSVFGGLASIPWIIKPLWGVLSDCFPFVGYKRKSYLLLTSFVAWLGFIFISKYDSNVALALCFFLCFQFGLSFQSVVGQAIVVGHSQDLNRTEGLSEDQKKKNSSNGISLFYFGKTFGKILSSLMIMLYLDEGNQQTFVFAISFVPIGLFLISLLLPEKRLRSTKKPRLVGETPYSSPGDYNEVMVNSNESPSPNQTNTSDLRTNTLKTFVFLKNPLILQAIALVFLNSFIPPFTQPKFYYYTNHLGFEASYLGFLKLLANVADVIAIILYTVFLSKVNLKKFYSIAALVNVPLTLSMLILLLRINLKYQIPDKLFVALDTFVCEFNLEMAQIPVLALASRLCPRNVEAIVFAIFVAVLNLGVSLSSELAAVVIAMLGVTEQNFDNIWVLPIITAVFQLSPFLILWKIKYEDAVKHTENVD